MLNTSTEWFAIKAPDQQAIRIPIQVIPETDPYIALSSKEKQKAYYLENGYLVCRNLISEELCDSIKKSFDQEVKPYDGHIYRQTSSIPEKHKLTEAGYMLNSIKHIQDMDKKQFPDFIEKSLSAITDAKLTDLIHYLLDDQGVIVQTMCFEGNPSTPAHYDAYYLDSADSGKMVAVWIALEDIQPGAGRFFVYPKSHKKELPLNKGEYEVAFHHDQFLKEISRLIGEPDMTCHAPALKKGDVLLWNANTIHGSLETTQPEFSRFSLTAHFIPKSKGYCLFQDLEMSLNLKTVQGYPVHSPKDPTKLENKIQMFCLQNFPSVTNFARNCFIKMLRK